MVSGVVSIRGYLLIPLIILKSEFGFRDSCYATFLIMDSVSEFFWLQSVAVEIAHARDV